MADWQLWIVWAVVYGIALFLENRRHRRAMTKMTESRDSWKQLAERGAAAVEAAEQEVRAAREELQDLRNLRDNLRNEEVRVPSLSPSSRQEIARILREGRTGMTTIERDEANRSYTVTMTDGRRFTVSQDELQNERVRVLRAPDAPRTRLFEGFRQATERAVMSGDTLRVQIPAGKDAADLPKPPQRDGKRKITIPGVQPPARK